MASVNMLGWNKYRKQSGYTYTFAAMFSTLVNTQTVQTKQSTQKELSYSDVIGYICKPEMG